MRKGDSLSVLLIAFLVIFVPSIQAAPPPTFAWHTFYGSSDYDEGYDIAADGSGNVYVTGYSSTTWNGPAGQSPLHAHSGNEDIFVLKLDSSGSYLWHTFYGSSGFDYTNGITADGSGNLYITGESNATWNGPAGETPLHARSGDYDIFVLKLDGSGSYLWHTFYGSSGFDEGYEVATDGSGNVYVTGYSNGSWNGPGGEPPFHAYSGGSDIFVLKLDSSGSYQWHTFYGSTLLADAAYKIVLDCNGNLYVTGRSDAAWYGPEGQSPLRAHSGNYDIFVLKLDSSGTYQWHTFYGSSGFDEGYGIATDGSGNVYVTGYSTPTWNGPAGETPLHPYSGSLDILVLKLDSSGSYQWHTFYGSTLADIAYEIVLDGSGNVYITGSSSATWNGPAGESPPHAYSGSNDIFVLKLDSSGSYQWHAFYGSSDYDEGYAIATDGRGNAYVTGFSTATWIGPDGQSPLHAYSGDPDIFVLKLAAPAPDLIETAVSDPPADSTAGSSFSVTDSVMNQGSASAGASVTSYYLSLDTTKGSEDILLTGSRSVPSLGINETNEGILTVTIPSSTAAGSYFLLACADDTNLVQESLDNNNCIPSTTKVSVGPVVSVTATDPTAAEGGDTGTFRITRTGAATAGLSVHFAMSGSAGNGSDYNTITSPVTIPIGSPYVDIILTPINDSIYEGDESALLTLSANAAYQIGSPSSATITIQDDDLQVPLSVVSPNGGETLAAGSTQTIQWSYTGNPGSYVKIELLKGGVVTKVISTLARIGSGGSGSYNWAIPSNQTPASDYSIRITSRTNGSYTDTSDSNFTVMAPSLTLISPNGGENWVPGTTQTIRWIYTGGPGTYLKIELLKGGILNRTITYLAVTSRGSFSWRIPATQVPGADYSIRITSRTNPAFTDTSNSNFTVVAPTVTLTSPNGGEEWQVGTTQTIGWTYTGGPGTYLKIELLKGGILNRTITSLALTNKGSFSWKIPATQVPGADYSIRITSRTISSCTDTSDSDFTIGP